MATYIRNNADLIKAGKQLIYKQMLILQKKLPDYLEQYIMSEYYDQYTPVMYERSFRILAAITSSEIVDVGIGYQLEVYLDPNKVSYDPSVWAYPDGATSYIQGDDPLTVFNNMANGIHGFIGNPRPYQTEGRFWEEFLNAIGHGGVYDMFVGFKRFIASKGYLIA
jgi:hypothetical protein